MEAEAQTILRRMDDVNRFRRFTLHAAKVRGEWDLVAAAFDLRRLQAMALALR